MVFQKKTQAQQPDPKTEKIQKELEEIQRKQKELIDQEMNLKKTEPTTSTKTTEEKQVTPEDLIIALRDPGVASLEKLNLLESINLSLNKLIEKMDELIDVAKE